MKGADYHQRAATIVATISRIVHAPNSSSKRKCGSGVNSAMPAPAGGPLLLITVIYSSTSPPNGEANIRRADQKRPPKYLKGAGDMERDRYPTRVRRKRDNRARHNSNDSLPDPDPNPVSSKISRCGCTASPASPMPIQRRSKITPARSRCIRCTTISCVCTKHSKSAPRWALV